MEFNIKQKSNAKNLELFAQEMQRISRQIGMKSSARGWCYLMETEGVITKAEFDRVESLINSCRKKGILPIDFISEEGKRDFSGVEEPTMIKDGENPIQHMKGWIEAAMESETYYTPDWWAGEEYYIQMIVEKIDLKTLFTSVCTTYHIPIATCFDSNTEILTKEGWKRFPELTKQTKIATMNKRNELIYQKPIRIINEKYKGLMYQIKNRATDQMITPNHKVYVMRQRNNPKNLRFELIPIKEVVHLQNLKFKKNIVWRGAEKETFSLPKIKSNGGANVIKDRIKMDTWLEFLGFYLSEGCSSHKKGSRFIVQLAQKRGDVHLKMQDCISNMGYTLYVGESIEISNKQLYTYLHPLGKSYEKFIPKEFLNLSPRQLNILLDSLIEGDGHRRKNGRAVYVTSSKQLADDVQELALRAGYFASISLKPKSSGIIRGRKIKSQRQCYLVNICKSRDTFRINHTRKDWTTKQYDGKIYCVEVPNNLIYVRRNGKPVWSGNSSGWSSMLQRAIYAKRFQEAEDRGLKPVLLYCGDHDPDGLRISDFIRNNLEDLKGIEWEDGTEGFDPEGLEIVRFGLNYEFIQQHNLTWIDNLITGSKRNLASPAHKNFKMPYVQKYLKDIGARKCEANVLMTVPDKARELVEGAITDFLGEDALSRFKKKRDDVNTEVEKFREKTGMHAALQKALDLIDKEEQA